MISDIQFDKIIFEFNSGIETLHKVVGCSVKAIEMAQLGTKQKE